MHADEVVSNMFDSLEVVRIAAPGALICNQCCLQRQQQWCVAVACPLSLSPLTRERLHTCTSLVTSYTEPRLCPAPVSSI